jgi:hypothetical protein
VPVRRQACDQDEEMMIPRIDYCRRGACFPTRRMSHKYKLFLGGGGGGLMKT